MLCFFKKEISFTTFTLYLRKHLVCHQNFRTPEKHHLVLKKRKEKRIVCTDASVRLEIKQHNSVHQHAQCFKGEIHPKAIHIFLWLHGLRILKQTVEQNFHSQIKTLRRSQHVHFKA